MSLRVVRSPLARIDIIDQCGWYEDLGGSELADRYVDALRAALADLVRAPLLGAVRDYGRHDLSGVRKWQAAKPFSDSLIFYLLFGNRDLRGSGVGRSAGSRAAVVRWLRPRVKSESVSGRIAVNLPTTER